MQRSTMAAALRAQAREKQRLVEEGVLDEDFFAEGTAQIKRDKDRAATRDDGPRRRETRIKLSRGKRAKARAIGDDDDDDDDDDEEEEANDGHADEDDAMDDGSEDALERKEPGSARDLASRRLQEATYGDEDDELLRLQTEDRSEVPLEAFNLAKERSQGYFDKSGNYVLTRRDLAREDDEDQDEDWVHNEVAAVHNNEDAADAAGTKRPRPVAREPLFHVQRLIDVLKDPNETVLKALARLGKAKDKDALNRVTESANALLDSRADIYQSTRHKLDAEIADTRRSRMDKTFWQYRIGDGETYGPFNATAMAAWRAQGYFDGADKESLRFRRAPGPAGEDSDEPASSGNESKRRKVTFAKSAKEDLAADFDDDSDDDDDNDAKGAEAVAAGNKLAANGSPGKAQPRDETPWLPLSAVSFSQVFE